MLLCDDYHIKKDIFMFKNISNKKKLITTIFIASFLVLVGCQSQPPHVTSINTLEKNISTETNTYIALDQFFDKTIVKNVQMSPDGNWLAFLKQSGNLYNLFLVRKGQSLSNAIALTALDDDVDKFWWSNTAGEIIFSKDHQGNENQQIYKLNFNQINHAQPPHTIRLTHNDDVNYMFISFPTELTNTILLLANHDEIKRSDFYHLDIKNQKITNIHKNIFNFNSWFANKVGEIIVGSALNSDNTSSFYAKTDNKWHKLIDTKSGESFEILNVDKDIAFISADIEGRDKKELLLINLLSGKIDTFHHDPKQESDLYSVVFDKTGQPLIVSYYGERLSHYSLNKSVQHTLDKIYTHFKNDVDITIDKIDKDKRLWTISVAYANQPTKNYIYNSKQDTYIDLLNETPKVSPERLGERKSIHYKARDGVTIQAYLTLPKKHKNNLPTIILPHGGPWSRDTWAYSGHFFNSIAFFFANRGYAVLQPNFRGSLGFGKKFTQLGERNWGTGTMQQDLTDGVDHLISLGIADKDRVGIMGASYGGYAALSGATFTPDVYSAVISFVGPSSLITLMESFPEYYRPYLGAWFAAVGDPEIIEDRQDMESRSPINFVDRIKAPIMLIQGANDPRVTQAESDNIAREMYKKGKEVEYVLALDEGHGFRNHNNLSSSILAMEEFFSKHLGGINASYMNKAVKVHLETLRVDVSKL
jgi:dipeptidyl aminopeptidase/acylaminoacyl peptidase